MAIVALSTKGQVDGNFNIGTTSIAVTTHPSMPCAPGLVLGALSAGQSAADSG
ncbi:hypothetical protein GCM10009811_06400 [Nostocoides veronense]|uniref:Uncharacterized protein n=1 Tax=Nostocoides veronense TaxID=330836 RepID=A0ABP4XMI9_9MICO